MATIDVKDAVNATQTVERPLPPGQALMTASRPVVIASNQSTIPIGGNVTVDGIPSSPLDRGAGPTGGQTMRVSIASEQVEAGEYEDVPASSGSTTIGVTGAAGDFLSSIIFFPENLNPGAVTLQDGALTPVTVFVGGSPSVSNMVPFSVYFGNTSVNGGWKITTSTGIHVRVVGNFT